MIGDRQRQALFETYGRGVLQSRVLISLDAEPLKPQEMPLTNPNLRYTRMSFFLRNAKAPKSSSVNKKKNYVIYSDIILSHNEAFRFNKWEEVLEEAEKNKELKFILEYTNLNEDMFEIFKENLFYDFPVNFDYTKYNHDVKSKIEARTGKWPNYSVFIDPLLIESTTEPLRDWLKKYNEEI